MPDVAPDYTPWLGGPFRWRLGLRPLALDQWIELDDETYDADMAAKAATLRDHHASVVAALADDTADAASVEVRDTLIDHLVARRPDWFARTGDAVTNRRRGETLPFDSMHPLELAGRLVQEDLIVLTTTTASPDRAVFAAGSVCFPNRWDLRSKIGRSMTEVHAPVAQLNDQLADPIEKFFDRLTPERSFWRLGWGVLDTAELYQPLDGTARPRPERATIDDVHVRVERETLRRLPRTGAVLFTIRTYVRRLTDLRDRPGDGRRLLEALDAMPDDVAAYKQLRAVSEPAREFLSAAY